MQDPTAPGRKASRRNAFSFPVVMLVAAWLLTAGTLSPGNEASVQTMARVDYPPRAASSTILFAHIAIGGGYTTIFTLINTGNVAADANLILTDSKGNPLDADLTGLSDTRQSQSGQKHVPGSSMSLNLPPGGTRSIAANAVSASEPAKSGWARVESSTGSLNGFTTFQRSDNGILKTIAGVFSSESAEVATIPVDNDDTLQRFTGYALANPANEVLTYQILIVDPSGTVVETLSSSSLGPFQQVARFLHEDSPARGKFKGSMVLVSTTGQRFNVIALVQNNGLLTVVPSIAAKSPNVELTWKSELTLTRIDAAKVGSSTYASSSKLAAAWKGPAAPIDHYELQVSESATAITTRRTAPADTTSAALGDLKSATSYTLQILACRDTSCASYLQGDATASAATDEELWQLQGTGSTFAGVTKVVTDGNTKPHVFYYGAGAGAALEGKLQMYYDPLTSGEKGVRIATTPAPVSTSALSAAMFNRLGASVGLTRPSAATPLIASINTMQAIPLSPALGGRVRLIFEATGADQKTRIMQVDSVDGYVGQDFNSGASTVCISSADYSTGGGCAPTVIVGVAGDAVEPNVNLSNARQNKVGYPLLNNWRWDGAAGTFMIFTMETTAGCAGAATQQGYAVWDGARWKVQYKSVTCPKLFDRMQAPYPEHIGGTRYKMYFADNQGRVTFPSGIPAPGPVKVFYADGSRTGDAARVDFEDWEEQSLARDVRFLWPTGTELTKTERSLFDDFTFLAPNGNLSFQLMYSNITDGTFPPFIGMAVLLNP